MYPRENIVAMVGPRPRVTMQTANVCVPQNAFNTHSLFSSELEDLDFKPRIKIKVLRQSGMTLTLIGASRVPTALFLQPVLMMIHNKVHH